MAVKMLAGIIFTKQEVNVPLTISCPLAANTYRIPLLVAVTGDLSPATPSSKATLNNTGRSINTKRRRETSQERHLDCAGHLIISVNAMERAIVQQQQRCG